MMWYLSSWLSKPAVKATPSQSAHTCANQRKRLGSSVWAPVAHIGNDPMERGTLEMERFAILAFALLPRAQGTEVFRCLRHLLAPRLTHHGQCWHQEIVTKHEDSDLTPHICATPCCCYYCWWLVALPEMLRQSMQKPMTPYVSCPHTVLPNSPMTMRPAGLPSMSTSKNLR